MSFNDWLQTGIDNGYIYGPPFCDTHDGDPYLTPEEEAKWEAGEDPCVVVIRMRA